MAKVLVVDDDHHNQLILKELLSNEGYQVELAENGRQGLDVARRQLPDLIVSDIMMPEMNGFRLCREVKQDAQLRHQPFVFYTATFVEKEDEELAMSLGASRFVIKPQDNQQFIRIVREVLDDYHQGRLPVPGKPQANDETLLKMYESSMGRKLEEAVDRLQKEQQALILSQQRLKEAQEIAQLGHWELSLKGRQLSWSDETYRILGFKPQQFDASLESLLAVVHAEDRELVGNTIATSLERMASFLLDFRLQLASGEGRFVQMRGQMQCDNYGQPRYAIGTLQDLTDRHLARQERERLQTELFQAQKMESLGRLAGGVAHDFNNMLSAISGNAQLLGLRLPANDPLRRYLDAIQDAGQKAAGLVRQLIGFSRREISRPQPIDLNAVIHEMTRLLERVISENISIVTDLKDDLRPLLADRTQIEQVIMNLALNARDAMPAGGSLCLATVNRYLNRAEAAQYPGLAAGHYLQLTVADTGCGIEAEHLPLIFDPFFTTKSEEDGTGLGLATVYNVVKQNQGHVWVESEPGRGATFRILLPCVDTQARVAAEKEISAGHERGDETILLVEDQAAVRVVLRETLQEFGYRVIDAGDGLEAERLFEQHPHVSLLLTDVVLPCKGGCQLAVELQQQNPQLKVLYMSGHALKTVMEREGLASEVNFISKPVAIEELARAVRRVLDE